MFPPLTIRAVPVGDEIRPGTDLAALIAPHLTSYEDALRERLVVVVAQKAVSKAEGRLVYLDQVVPSAEAQRIAARTGKSAALVELVLQESASVVRAVPGVLIVRHRLGYIVANAGIDQSNVPSPDGREVALLLPRDPDAAARMLRARLASAQRAAPAVIISDSFGRPWRRGVINVALGCAGLPALVDWRGKPDRDSRPLRATEVALADALAAAAGLVMGEAHQSTPFVLIEGAVWNAPDSAAATLIRPLAEDLFQ